MNKRLLKQWKQWKGNHRHEVTFLMQVRSASHSIHPSFHLFQHPLFFLHFSFEGLYSKKVFQFLFFNFNFENLKFSLNFCWPLSYSSRSLSNNLIACSIKLFIQQISVACKRVVFGRRLLGWEGGVESERLVKITHRKVINVTQNTHINIKPLNIYIHIQLNTYITIQLQTNTRIPMHKTFIVFILPSQTLKKSAFKYT